LAFFPLDYVSCKRHKQKGGNSTGIRGHNTKFPSLIIGSHLTKLQSTVCVVMLRNNKLDPLRQEYCVIIIRHANEM